LRKIEALIRDGQRYRIGYGSTGITSGGVATYCVKFSDGKEFYVEVASPRYHSDGYRILAISE